MTPRRCRGFTLIEVMVALTIVALALAAATAAVAQMIDAGNTMRERTYANWIALNRIAELRLAGQTPPVGRSNGTVEYANAEWTWRAVVAETGVEDLYRIDVTVSLAGEEYELRTVTGFVGPAGSPFVSNSQWLGLPVWGGGQPGTPGSNPGGGEER